MAGESDKNFDWSCPEQQIDECGRSLPVTNTTTPMPDVKPPKETTSSGNDKIDTNDD